MSLWSNEDKGYGAFPFSLSPTIPAVPVISININPLFTPVSGKFSRKISILSRKDLHLEMSNLGWIGAMGGNVRQNNDSFLCPIVRLQMKWLKSRQTVGDLEEICSGNSFPMYFLAVKVAVCMKRERKAKGRKIRQSQKAEKRWSLLSSIMLSRNPIIPGEKIFYVACWRMVHGKQEYSICMKGRGCESPLKHMCTMNPLFISPQRKAEDRGQCDPIIKAISNE